MSIKSTEIDKCLSLVYAFIRSREIYALSLILSTLYLLILQTALPIYIYK